MDFFWTFGPVAKIVVFIMNFGASIEKTIGFCMIFARVSKCRFAYKDNEIMDFLVSFGAMAQNHSFY